MNNPKLNNMTVTERMVLLTTANKYNPGVLKFRPQTLMGLKENSSSTTTSAISVPNLMNADSTGISGTITKSSYIELELPQEVARNYPTKFIPPGTVFIASFNNGDMSKPTIIGGDWK